MLQWKLIDYNKKIANLIKSDNPIAKVILAHLCALNTRGDPSLRLENKLNLVKNLYPLGYTKDDIRMLYSFIDYTLNLPPELEKAFMNNIEQHEEEIKMQYITSAERIGRHNATQEILLKALNKYYCLNVPKEVQEKLQTASVDEMQAWLDKLLDGIFTEELIG